jgi:CBS-domain-containing membrane protein
MLVQEWMTKEVFHIGPDTSMMKASRLMKDKNIRRLPVLDDNQRVIGIISDRDIKEASPSKATTLDMHELYYLLSELKVKDIMTKNPHCAREKDSVEGVALILMEKGFGGMPVVDDDNKLVGIITESDIFKVLTSITGVQSGGMQLAFDLPNQRGMLRPVLDALGERGQSFVSILTSHTALGERGQSFVSILTSHTPDLPVRRVYIRVQPMSREQEKELANSMKSQFDSMVYWEPGKREQDA